MTGHDPEPDRAALDELRRAFGTDLASDPEAEDDPTTGQPYEFDIVEQDPLPSAAEPVESDAETSAPPATSDSPGQPPSEPGDPGALGDLTRSDTAPFEPIPDITPPAFAIDDPDPAEPVEPMPSETDAVRAPSIIRIDDYAGSTLLDDEPSLVEQPPVEAGDRQVISIEADDIPDAVYVSGSLDGDSSSSIVFIEDEAGSDALTPESDRDLRRGIEPRMRERRAAVRRAQGRKRLKWVILAAVLILVGVAALATLGSSLFAVRADQIMVTGNVYTDPEALQEVIDDLAGTPVLRVDTQQAERRLEQIPWVEEARVRTDFPHAVSIEIRERQAVATYQGPDGRFRVLDDKGRVLDVIEKYPFAYVLISGPDPVDLDPADIAPQGYVGAAELARNLTSSVRGQVERIEVTANGSRLVMLLDDGSEVRFGEARDLFVKLVRLETVLANNPGRVPGPIDVSTDETTNPGSADA